MKRGGGESVLLPPLLVASAQDWTLDTTSAGVACRAVVGVVVDIIFAVVVVSVALLGRRRLGRCGWSTTGERSGPLGFLNADRPFPNNQPWHQLLPLGISSSKDSSPNTASRRRHEYRFCGLFLVVVNINCR